MEADTSHVVIISQHYPPDRSGNASRIRDTATKLAETDVDVTVLAPLPAFPHGEFDRSWERTHTDTENGVTAHRLWAWQPITDDPGFGTRLAYYLTFPFHALLWLLAHYREYDAIVTSSPPIFTGFAALPFGLFGLKPWVVDVRDLWIDASVGLGFIKDGGILELASRAYQRLVLSTADRITVTTNVLGDRIAEQYGVSREKIHHLPNGVDTKRYKPTVRSNDTEDPPTIVYTGNVGYAQDIEACIEAMNEIDRSDARLKIVGDGDLRGELEALVERRDLEDKVEFTGLVERDEIPEILNESTVSIAPLKRDQSLEYAIPTKVYEYMACELPVVATGIGEIRTVIEESNGGVFVENDPKALARAFDDLLENPDRREEVGGRGREYVEREYDRGAIARRLGRILDEVSCA